MLQQFSAFKRKYELEHSYPTNISSGYLADSGSTWGVWEMIRESIQNMMDEAEYTADANGGELLDYCKISLWTNCIELIDRGRGVDFAKIFLIGESGKRGSHYRGQKGEGEGLSFLIAARNGIDKVMFSKDWALRARLDSAFGGYEVLVFDLYRTAKPIQGTIWRYDRTPEIAEVYHNIANYFPQLSKREQRRQEAENRKAVEMQRKIRERYTKQREQEVKAKSTSSTRTIITPAKGQIPRLFVRGIFVKDIYSLFSYNLKDVQINRDRNMVNEWDILGEVQKAFNSDDLTMAQACMYWKSGEDVIGDAGLLEYKTIINFDNNRQLMIDAFYKTYGKKACVASDRTAALDAEGIGFKVVDLHPYVRDTARNLGIKSDRSALGYTGDMLIWNKPPKQVTALISKLQEIGKAFGFKNWDVVPVLKKLQTNGADLGWFGNGTVYLLRHTLEGDRLMLLETYIHECGHGESGQPDATRAFTQWFETMLIQALTGKWDKVRNLIDEFMRI